MQLRHFQSRLECLGDLVCVPLQVRASDRRPERACNATAGHCSGFVAPRHAIQVDYFIDVQLCKLANWRLVCRVQLSMGSSAAAGPRGLYGCPSPYPVAHVCL